MRPRAPANWRATAWLQSRDQDGSNQRGALATGAYADWTGDQAVNSPDLVLDPTRWQPLRRPTATGGTVVQKFLTPQWGRVRPFALTSGSVVRPAGLSALAPTQAEMLELIDYSAGLDDDAKALVGVWAANPGSVSPPGQWLGLAEQVSRQDSNTLDEDVKLFFGVGQAVLGASIAAWDAKRTDDSVRPISAIRYVWRGQAIRSWGGAGRCVWQRCVWPARLARSVLSVPGWPAPAGQVGAPQRLPWPHVDWHPVCADRRPAVGAGLHQPLAAA